MNGYCYEETKHQIITNKQTVASATKIINL